MTRSIVLAALLSLLLHPCAFAQSAGVVDDFAYADDSAARRAWVAQWGSSPVSRVEAGGRAALRFPCNFNGTTLERVTWDRRVNLDMVDCRAFEFDILCGDRRPISSFSIYFQSGGGWYSASFSPRPGQWQTITINKHDTRIEGTPAGWGAIRTIRISAWRGGETDTEFTIANMRLVGAGAPVAIIRNDSAASAGDARSISQFTEAMAGHLNELGIDHVTLSDGDLTPQRLGSKRLLILPYCPGLPTPAIEAIGGFLDGGGKIAAFYSMPGALSAKTGIDPGSHLRQRTPGHFASIRLAEPQLHGSPPVVRQRSWNIQTARPIDQRARIAAVWHDEAGQSTGQPALVVSDNAAMLTHVLLDDDRVAKQQFLLAMLGHLRPELWKTAASAAVDRIGRFGPFDGYDAARAQLGKSPAAAAELEAAATQREAVKACLAATDYPGAIAAAAAAQRHLVEAYCLAQSPIPGEFRAFWCHTATGPAGTDWDQSLRLLAENGFTAILPNMLWGGVAYYPSEILPVAEQAKQRDYLAECLAAARRHGVQCHVWKVNWNMSSRAPREFAERMKKEGRTQVRFDGSAADQWLCPSHPANQKLEIDSMLEVVRKYDVDGIHFDYIRYPDRNGCFCDGCRERFEKSIGRAIASWPGDVRRDRDLEQRWNAFRRENITGVVAAVSAGAKQIRPSVKISAAVFRNAPLDRDTIGQDWQLWCERGYLDFVCPMDYTEDALDFEQQVARQLQWRGRIPLYPGIGLTTWSQRDITKLIEQINVTRRLQTGGFIVFDYQSPEFNEIVPLCGKGITRREERQGR